MFWTIVGALMFVFIVLPILVSIFNAILEVCDKFDCADKLIIVVLIILILIIIF